MKSSENVMIKHGLLGLMLLSISSCIGTDVVDVELVDERLAIDTRLTSLAVGESYQFMADYFNNMGEEEMATVNWSSSNEGVISISAEGLAEAHMLGEAMERNYGAYLTFGPPIQDGFYYDVLI